MLVSGCAFFVAACAAARRQDSAEADTTEKTDTAPPAPASPCFEGSPDGDWLSFSLKDYPGLEDVYGSAVIAINGREVVIAQVDEDCYVGLDRRCTHQGCSIEYRDGNRFVCPCHGALFGFTGEVLGGPAPVPVDVHAVVREGDTLWVRPTPGLD
jgi:Rieske Fe-S protein